MRIFIAVNHIEEIGHRQTTALLIAAMVRKGCSVHLADVDKFSVQGGFTEHRPFVNATKFEIARNQVSSFQSVDVEAFAQSKPAQSRMKIGTGDLIFIRTNPGRDIERNSIHDSFLSVCLSAQSTGVRVVNDPANIRFFASKAALSNIDSQFRPVMIVSHDPVIISNFVRQSKIECVVKPVVGSRGQDVIRVQPNQKDLPELIALTFRDRGIIAQHFVKSDEPGDRRVVVANGKILEIDGQLGGIHRRPSDGDFRANIHAGGTAHKLTLTTKARNAVEHAARILNDHGIWLAGVDLIGDQIIEFNVFSTGGLYFAEEESGIDFSGAIISQLLMR